MIPEVLQEYEDDYRFFYDAAMRNIGFGTEVEVPEEVIGRILGGEHPIKVFREYRRFTQEKLARKVGISPAYLKSIEAGDHKPGRRLLSEIANVLRVELEEIE